MNMTEDPRSDVDSFFDLMNDVVSLRTLYTI